MDPDLNLEKATKLIRESEAIKLQQTTLRPDETTEVDAINRRPSWCHGQKGRQQQKPRQAPQTQPSAICTRCGQAPHSRMQCPARDQVCHKCKKKGHFRRLCRSKPVSKGIREVQENSDDNFMGAVHMDTTDCEAIDAVHNPWVTALNLNKRAITFKIDIGSDVTVISEADYDKDKDGSLSTCNKQLSDPSQDFKCVWSIHWATTKKLYINYKEHLRYPWPAHSTTGKAIPCPLQDGYIISPG